VCFFFFPVLLSEAPPRLARRYLQTFFESSKFCSWLCFLSAKSILSSFSFICCECLFFPFWSGFWRFNPAQLQTSNTFFLRFSYGPPRCFVTQSFSFMLVCDWQVEGLCRYAFKGLKLFHILTHSFFLSTPSPPSHCCFQVSCHSFKNSIS